MQRLVSGHQAFASGLRIAAADSEPVRSVDGALGTATAQGRGSLESEQGMRDWARQCVDIVGQMVRHIDALQSELVRLQNDMEAVSGGYRSTLLSGPSASSSSINGLRYIRRQGCEIGESSSHRGSERNRSRSNSRDNNLNSPLGERQMEKPGGDETSEVPGFVAETLPFQWPASLRRREGLEATAKSSVNRMETSHRSNQSPRRLGSGTMQALQGRGWNRSGGCLKHVMNPVHDPDSTLNAARKVAVILLLLYDALLIPYMLGFNLDFEGWIAYQLFFTASFWTIDMCFSFLQGFEEDGHLQTGFKQTALQYMSSFFILDLFVVVLDWLTAILVWTTTHSESGRIIRVLRLIRLAGLLRLRKISRIVLHHIFSADIEASSSLVFLVSSILGFIVFFNHFQACIWAYVGEHGLTDTGSHWVDMDVRVGDHTVPYQELNKVFKYTSIFHWHMAQLTVGNQGIHTANSVESAVNVIGLLVALMMACTVVSALSATLVNYQMSVRARTQQLRTLQQYLSENRVSYRTLNVAVRQAKERVRKSSRLTEKDVSALNLLSTTLRAALRYEISLPFMRSMPILRLWTSLEPTSAQQLCKESSSLEILLPHEVLFEAGEEALGMVRLNSGRAEYVQNPRTSTARAETSVEVGSKKIWMCEAALCSHWLHVGTFQALAPCEIFTVASKNWAKVLPSHHPFRDVACAFAAVYYKRLVSAKPPHSSWPDDLQVPYTHFSELVASMEPHVQQIIGIDALREAQSSNQVPEKKAGLLEMQVKNGKSVVFLDEAGQIKRVTSGVSLQILGPNGKSLMQIGKIKDDGEVTPSCMVPGHIRERDELPVESAKRLLESKLRPLVDQVELGAPGQEIETRMSPEYGISTQYIQIKFLGEMGPGFSIGAKHTFGDPNITVKGCLTSRQDSVILEDVPQAFIFPGEKKGTSYCFAWLNHEELAELQKAAPLVSWWLEALHAECCADTRENDEPVLQVTMQLSEASGQNSHESYEVLV